jgi:hypothetical protein
LRTARLIILLVASLLLAACTDTTTQELPGAAPTTAAFDQTAALPPPTSSSPIQVTPTLSITDIPATPTAIIQTATLPPDAPPLAEIQVTSSPTEFFPSYYLLSNLIGREVRSPEGHQLGSLAGLVIVRGSPTHPQVRYGLLAADPAVGLSEDQNLVFVPWELVSAGQNPADKLSLIRLNAEPRRLAQAPSFAASSLPGTHQPGWDADLAAYWGVQSASLPVTGDEPAAASQTPAAQTEAPTASGQASQERALLVRGKLVNLRLNANTDELIGVIEDFVLHPQSGQIAFVLMAFEGRLIPAPLDQLAWIVPPGENEIGVLQLILPAEILNGAPAFTNLEEFSEAPPGWEQTTSDYWQTQAP